MSLRIALARIKRRVLKKPYLKDKQYPPYWFNKTLAAEPAFVMQIGSNDGKTGDPLNYLLNKYLNWKGIFVEPVPYLFERLKSNYPDKSRFLFENVAVNEGSELDFYWVDPKAKDELNELPFWFDQLGSFNRQHIVNQLGEKLEPYILEKKLEGITLPSLLERAKTNDIDIMHIDTEGYDWKILSQLNLNECAPNFILYESNHLSSDELTDSINFLESRYELFDVGIDVLAVNKSFASELMGEMKKHMKKLTLN